MKKITILCAFLILTFCSVTGQTTIYDWDTAAVDNGDNVTETIGSITTTVSDVIGAEDLTFASIGDAFGSSGNVLINGNPIGAPISATSIKFTFSEAVDVVSILAMEGNAASIDYTFTPTGGNNSPVTVSLSGGVTIANLNWTGVTSFTVTSSGSWFAFDDLTVSPNTYVPPTTIYDWDKAAIDNGDNVTETIGSITTTVSDVIGTEDLTFASIGDAFGSSGNVLINGNPIGAPISATSIKFTFSEAVDVVSILAMEGNAASIDYTFTPTGGNNSPVTVSLSGGVATANLNWTGVTSFTVTSSGSWFAFDDLTVSPNTYVPPTTIYDWDTAAVDNGDNVTETIGSITTTVSDVVGTEDLTFASIFDAFGSSGNVLINGDPNIGASIATSITFTFNEAVDVISILAMDGVNASIDYTFTPTGGNNSPVTVSLSGNTTTANLNWTGVTSFTVTSSGSWFAFDDLTVSPNTYVPPTTIYDWDTAAIDNGDNVTETIGSITTTVSDVIGTEDLTFASIGDAFGSSGNVLINGDPNGTPTSATSIKFTFSEAVDVVSILAMEGNAASIDYTFTPTGGNNSPVTVSLSGGVATANLNWTGVTSFTVTSSGSWFAFDDLTVSPNTYVPPPPTVFGWDTPSTIDNGDTVSETINGITLTVSDSFDINFFPSSLYGVVGNKVGNVGTSSAVPVNETSITFTFSEPVNIASILAIDGNGFSGTPDIDYTFTPTGGSNPTVIQTLPEGRFATANLNWVGVTSFTVTSPGSWFSFDHLTLDSTLSTKDELVLQKAKVYPNPVENILHIKNVADLKSINIYNSLGQHVLQTENKIINVSHLSKGIYILKINTSQGIETKRIIKR